MIDVFFYLNYGGLNGMTHEQLLALSYEDIDSLVKRMVRQKETEAEAVEKMRSQ